MGNVSLIAAYVLLLTVVAFAPQQVIHFTQVPSHDTIPQNTTTFPVAFFYHNGVLCAANKRLIQTTELKNSTDSVTYD